MREKKDVVKGAIYDCVECERKRWKGRKGGEVLGCFLMVVKEFERRRRRALEMQDWDQGK